MGDYSAPPNPLAGFQDPTTKGRDGRGEDIGERKGGEERKGKGKNVIGRKGSRIRGPTSKGQGWEEEKGK